MLHLRRALPGHVVVAALAMAGLLAPAGLGDASPFGINAHIPPQVVVDEVAAAGIGWVRIDFMWSLVEPERDRYDWELYDALLDRLEGSGLRPYATLQATPAWATAGPEFSGVPRDPGDWQEFVYLAAARYRGRISAWGLWNEPNLPRFWAGTRRQYIDTILLPGARAVRAADPGALIGGPDLAHLSSADWDSWLRQVIAEAGHELDLIAHHAYPGDGGASAVFEKLDSRPPWQPLEPTVREVLQSAGWWGRPFWLTETGVESARVGWTPQAEFYDDVVRDWFGPSPRARWMDRVFFYQIHDPPAPDTSTFGILGAWPDLQRKSAYFAYANAIATTPFVDGEVIDLDAPAFVLPGAVAEIRVTVRNTGWESWRGDAGFHLEVSSDLVAWQVLEHLLPTDFEVPPGAVAQALIPVQAPWIALPSVATATVRARMVAGDGRLFGDPITAVITATHHRPAQILRQPRGGIVPEGRTAVLSLEATSETPLVYHWRRNSIVLVDGDRVRGSGTSRLELVDLDPSLAGDFDCVVGNAAGTVVSDVAWVRLGTPAPRRPSAPVAPAAARGAPAAR